jgi:hypothetical protein
MKIHKLPLILALVAATFAHTASGFLVNFGADFDEDGGFNADGTGSWSIGANSVNYERASGALANASFLRDLSLSTTAGSAYSFRSVINYLNAGPIARPSRVGLSLFTTSNTVAGTDTGIHLALMTLDQQFVINRGINQYDTQVLWTGAALGSGIFTLEGTVSFTDVAANISFTVTDYNNHSQTSTASIALSELLLGSFGGIGTRNRPDDTGIEFEIQSFEATVVPEPGTYALLSGILALGVIVIRRRRFSSTP